MGGRTDRWQSPGGLENRHACVARSFQFSLLRQVTEVVSALWHVFPLYIVFNFVRIMGGGRRLTPYCEHAYSEYGRAGRVGGFEASKAPVQGVRDLIK